MPPRSSGRLARDRSLDPDEREIVDKVLGEAVLSDEEWRRFDALALINEFKIVSAEPALRELARKLDVSTVPGAPYELKKVHRVIVKLAERDI